MRKIIKIAISIFTLLIFLTGCQQQGQLFNGQEAIKEVRVFFSTEFKKENTDVILSSNEMNHPELLEIMQTILNEATKQEGVVDTIEPNYYVEIIDQDRRTKELYFWLVNEEGGKGSFMEVEDTHTIYNFSTELNTQFIHLLEAAEN